MLEGGSRIIFRLSGTGSSGSTIRMYIEKYLAEGDVGEASVVMKGLIDIGLSFSRMKEFTGMDAPTVIT